MEVSKYPIGWPRLALCWHTSWGHRDTRDTSICLAARRKTTCRSCSDSANASSGTRVGRRLRRVRPDYSTKH